MGIERAESALLRVDRVDASSCAALPSHFHDRSPHAGLEQLTDGGLE
jgi:hypothetical protein